MDMAVLVGGFCASTGILAYQMISGELINTLVVPASGYILSNVGHHYKSETMSDLGNSMILASILHLPGMFSGYAVYAVGGKSLVAKTIACITGSVVTYKVYGDAFSRAFESLLRSMPFGK
jgi:hypothetical protein